MKDNVTPPETKATKDDDGNYYLVSNTGNVRPVARLLHVGSGGARTSPDTSHVGYASQAGYASQTEYAPEVTIEALDNYCFALCFDVPDFSDSDFDVEVKKAPNSMSNVRDLLNVGRNLQSGGVSRDKDSVSAKKRPDGHRHHGCVGRPRTSFEWKFELCEGVRMTGIMLRGDALFVMFEYQPPAKAKKRMSEIRYR